MRKTLVASYRLLLLGLVLLAARPAAAADAGASPAQSPPVEEANSASSPVREGPAILDPREHRIGRLVDDVEVRDVDGQPVKLSAFRGRPLVVCMTSPHCPVSRRYLPVLAALQKEYGPRGVGFLAVNVTGADRAAAMRDALTASGFAAPCVSDLDGSVAAALGAQSSTDAFVVDGARTLVYRGAVDDQFGLGYSLAAPKRQFLRDALDAVLAGTAPAVADTPPVGCTVKWRS